MIRLSRQVKYRARLFTEKVETYIRAEATIPSTSFGVKKRLLQEQVKTNLLLAELLEAVRYQVSTLRFLSGSPLINFLGSKLSTYG